MAGWELRVRLLFFWLKLVYYYRTYEKAVSGVGREGKRRTCAKGHYQPRPVLRVWPPHTSGAMYRFFLRTGNRLQYNHVLPFVPLGGEQVLSLYHSSPRTHFCEPRTRVCSSETPAGSCVVPRDAAAHARGVRAGAARPRRAVAGVRHVVRAPRVPLRGSSARAPVSAPAGPSVGAARTRAHDVRKRHAHHVRSGWHQYLSSGTCTPCPANAGTGPDEPVGEADISGTRPTARLLPVLQQGAPRLTPFASALLSACMCNAGFQGTISSSASTCTKCVQGKYKADWGEQPCVDCETGACVHVCMCACVHVCMCACVHGTCARVHGTVRACGARAQLQTRERGHGHSVWSRKQVCGGGRWQANVTQIY